MHVGAVARDITPDRRLHLGGFAARSHPMTGVVGYMPTPEELARGGYEASVAHIYYGQPRPLSAEAEPAVRRFFADAWSARW